MRRALLVVAVTALGTVTPTWAIDHRDGPAVQVDPSTDIANVYSWMSADASKVYLVMTVYPNATTTAKFSSTALYVFNLSSLKTYGDTSPTKRTVICQFDAAQKISCWGPDGSGELVSGDASATAGLASSSGKMKVFAGLRDDSTFFNIAGFKAAAATLKGALAKDPGGCPKALASSAPTLATLLISDGMAGPGKDGFRKGGDFVLGYNGNVLALVVSLDKSLVTDATHPLLGVWASTNKVK